MARDTTGARAVGRLVRWTTRLVLLALALTVLSSVVVLVVVPRAIHGSAMTVLTGSMTPEIPVGSIVMVRPVDPGTLEVGDVATYQPTKGKASYITHRVAKIDTSTTPTSFTFKGDANRGADVKPVPAGAIRGKVWFHVPYLGAIRDGLHGKGGISLVGMLVLGGYAISQVSGAVKERKNRRRYADGAATTGTQPLVLDRTLILTTLAISFVDDQTGLTPDQAARQWGAILVDEDLETFQLLIAPPGQGTVAAVEMLLSLHALSIQVLEAPVTLTGRPVRLAAPTLVPLDADTEGGRATG